MRILKMFITAVCVVFLLKLRWPKNKSLYESNLLCLQEEQYIPFIKQQVSCYKY